MGVALPTRSALDNALAVTNDHWGAAWLLGISVWDLCRVLFVMKVPRPKHWS